MPAGRYKKIRATDERYFDALLKMQSACADDGLVFAEEMWVMIEMWLRDRELRRAGYKRVKVAEQVGPAFHGRDAGDRAGG